MKSALVGARIPRLEDPALLRGRARFVDDLRFPGLAHGSFVRSGEAHARIRRVDAGRARAAPGVLAVLTLDDIRPHVTSARMPLGQPSAAIRHALDPPILADGEVRHVGEPVALVIADHPYRAEDAASLVAIDYETLPAAIDCRAALAPGAAPAHAALADNLVARLDIGYGDCEAAFARAAHVVDAAMHQHKGLGQAIECRGVLARPDPNDGGLTVWSGTQMPHRGHMVLCQLLGCEEDALRVVAPRCRRRVRTQVRLLRRRGRGGGRRADRRTAGQVDRGPARALHRDHPGARPVLGHGDGAGRRRTHAGGTRAA